MPLPKPPPNPTRVRDTQALIRQVWQRYGCGRAHVAEWLAPLLGARPFQVRLWRAGKTYPSDAQFEALKEEFFLNYEAALVEKTYVFDGVAELIERIS